MSASPVYLHGPRYVLGEVAADYTSIADLPAKAERFRMQVSAGLWGWGGVYRTERPLEAMAIDSGTATLAAAGLEPSTIDALVLVLHVAAGLGRRSRAVRTGSAHQHGAG
jgi:3-oxoacyl-[acyl-carrier-protein] synthase III